MFGCVVRCSLRLSRWAKQPHAQAAGPLSTETAYAICTRKGAMRRVARVRLALGAFSRKPASHKRPPTRRVQSIIAYVCMVNHSGTWPWSSEVPVPQKPRAQGHAQSPDLIRGAPARLPPPPSLPPKPHANLATPAPCPTTCVGIAWPTWPLVHLYTHSPTRPLTYSRATHTSLCCGVYTHALQHHALAHKYTLRPSTYTPRPPGADRPRPAPPGPVRPRPVPQRISTDHLKRGRQARSRVES